MTVLAVATSVVAPACGLGDKARLEEQITSAPARYDGAIVSGTVTVESRLTKLPAGVSALGGGIGAAPGAATTPTALPRGGLSRGTVAVGFTLDLGSSAASLAHVDASGQPTEQAVVFDDLVLYGRRGGVPADDARPWVRLDLEDLEDTAGEIDPISGAPLNAIYALHPALLADLVAGTLAGSIRQKADAESVEGATDRFAVNVSVRKALEDRRRSRYPEDRRESVEQLLRLLGVVGDLHPGEVWLDAEGRIRRFRVQFRQEPRRRVEFRMIVSADMAPLDAASAATETFTAPAPDQVLGVDSVLRFTSTVVATGVPGVVPDEPPAEATP